MAFQLACGCLYWSPPPGDNRSSLAPSPAAKAHPRPYTTETAPWRWNSKQKYCGGTGITRVTVDPPSVWTAQPGRKQEWRGGRYFSQFVYIFFPYYCNDPMFYRSNTIRLDIYKQWSQVCINIETFMTWLVLDWNLYEWPWGFWVTCGGGRVLTLCAQVKVQIVVCVFGGKQYICYFFNVHIKFSMDWKCIYSDY